MPFRGGHGWFLQPSFGGGGGVAASSELTAASGGGSGGSVGGVVGGTIGTSGVGLSSGGVPGSSTGTWVPPTGATDPGAVGGSGIGGIEGGARSKMFCRAWGDRDVPCVRASSPGLRSDRFRPLPLSGSVARPRSMRTCPVAGSTTTDQMASLSFRTTTPPRVFVSSQTSQAVPASSVPTSATWTATICTGARTLSDLTFSSSLQAKSVRRAPMRADSRL